MPPATLCCSAEQRGGSSSPDLPNARPSDAPPAQRLLLQNTLNSEASGVTSIPSEDMHELQQIFISAADGNHSRTRIGHLRSSASLHNLHNMKSMGALIKKKLSKDMSRTQSKSSVPSGSVQARKSDAGDAQGTVVKNARNANMGVNVTSKDLKKDLLSNKGPDEGGYDDDALELDDVVKKLGRKTPPRRLSIHSVQWTTPTTDMSKASDGSSRADQFRSGWDVLPYQISKYTPSSSLPSSPSMGLFASSPSMRVKWKLKARQLRRSHSTSTLANPRVPALVPIRLSSVSSVEATEWSISMAESLTLSRFSSPSLDAMLKGLDSVCDSTYGGIRNAVQEKSLSASCPQSSQSAQLPPVMSFEAFRRSITENIPREPVTVIAEKENISRYMSDEAESIHLYDMRISRHLRSTSLLSSAPSIDTPKDTMLTRIDSSHATPAVTSKRDARKTSSSGFASTKIPLGWGVVVESQETEQGDGSSSIYSSRAQSPVDNVKTLTVNLGSIIHSCKKPTKVTSTINSHPPKSSLDTSVSQASETVTKSAGLEGSPPSSSAARPSFDPFFTATNDKEDATTTDTLLLPVAPFAVASVNSSQTSLSKKSRFREDFSPSPLKKKPSKHLTAVSKFLLTRGHSIANLLAFDGPSDESDRSTHDMHLAVNPDKHDKQKERRLSRSMISLKAEQDSVAHHHDSSPMWERALKQYQEERSTMFLSPEKASTGTLHRERSDSSVRRPSFSTSSKTHPSLPSTTEERISFEFGLDPSSPTGSPSGLSSTTHGGLTPVSPGRSPALLPLPIPSGSSISGAISEVDWDKAGLDNLKKRMFEGPEDKDAIGAWAQYPSHTRDARNASAGPPKDAVLTRDFAFEPSNIGTRVMKSPARANTMFSVQSVFSTTSPHRKSIGEDNDDGDVSPRGKEKMPTGKSHSMTFGKTFLKNYGKLFRSTSSDFRKYGHGHRSSTAKGGMLEYPELEMLPEVFAPRRSYAQTVEMMPLSPSLPEDADVSTSTENEEIGVAKWLNRNTDTDGSVDERNPLLDGAGDLDLERSTDCIPFATMPTEKQDFGSKESEGGTANVWSRFYASCVDSPRGTGTSLDNVRDSLSLSPPANWPLVDEKRAVCKSATALGLLTRLSDTELCKAVGERRSASAGVASVGVEAEAKGVKVVNRVKQHRKPSECSVRKSTVELVEELMEVERLEREKVMLLGKVDSHLAQGVRVISV